MTDHWTDVRKWLKNMEGEEPWWFEGPNLRLLLTDADALLDSVPALGGFVWLENNLHRYGSDEWLEYYKAAMKDAHKALAALPEHLTHEHEWVDITNEVISGGYTCLGCGAIVAALPEHLK